MTVLKKALEKARTQDSDAVACAVAGLSVPPEEVANQDYFSTDPISGFDAAQLAVRLFECGHLKQFADFLADKKLSPNIVLGNGQTLLQNCLVQFPKDMARLTCLLKLGANPNLFLRKNDSKSFSANVYRPAYHPLNFAFANCPAATTPDICRELRKYGSSIEGLKYYLEVDPANGQQDNEEKAALRQSLIALAPDPECTKLVRNDVDLSVMQKELVGVEAQLSAAGFQVVKYVPPVRSQTSRNHDEMVDLPSHYSFEKFHSVYAMMKDIHFQAFAQKLLNYPGGVNWNGSNILFQNGDESIFNRVKVTFCSKDQNDLFKWSQPDVSKVTHDGPLVYSDVNSIGLLIFKNTETNLFKSYISGVVKAHDGSCFFADPISMQIKLIDIDKKMMSACDRRDLLGNVSAQFNYLSIYYNAVFQQVEHSRMVAEIHNPARPNDFGGKDAVIKLSPKNE